VSSDWAGRAGTVEEAIRRRFVRRLAGVVPGTRIGRVRWPRPLSSRPLQILLGPWHYWWQAHLLDCLVDAHRRAPQPWRALEIAALARTVRLRNFGSWTNDYYDDIAWFGLAVQRAGPLARRSAPSALAAITARLRAGWTPAGGGGIWWRRGDDFKNAPAKGSQINYSCRFGCVVLSAGVPVTV
jgi:predicted alpha-1,6-mannanase (GH76 family)